MTSPCCRSAFLDMLRRFIPVGTVSHASAVLPFVVVVVVVVVVDVVAVEFCAEASAKKSRFLLLSLVE